MDSKVRQILKYHYNQSNSKGNVWYLISPYSKLRRFFLFFPCFCNLTWWRPPFSKRFSRYALFVSRTFEAQTYNLNSSQTHSTKMTHRAIRDILLDSSLPSRSGFKFTRITGSIFLTECWWSMIQEWKCMTLLRWAGRID